MKTLNELRIETSGQTRLLWEDNRWDGPLSGVMLWNGEKCYFSSTCGADDEIEKIPLPEDEWKIVKDNWFIQTGEVLPEDDEDRYEYVWHRYFHVYRIPENIMCIMESNHQLFSDNVGTHCDYDESGHRCLSENYLKPYHNHKKFYKHKQKYELDLLKCEIIGQFEQ